MPYTVLVYPVCFKHAKMQQIIVICQFTIYFLYLLDIHITYLRKRKSKCFGDDDWRKNRKKKDLGDNCLRRANAESIEREACINDHETLLSLITLIRTGVWLMLHHYRHQFRILSVRLASVCACCPTLAHIQSEFLNNEKKTKESWSKTWTWQNRIIVTNCYCFTPRMAAKWNVHEREALFWNNFWTHFYFTSDSVCVPHILNNKIK